MKSNKLASLLIGIFNFNQQSNIVDERGGYFVRNLTGSAVIGYNYISGRYAGYFYKFSQSVDVALLPRLERSLDDRIPNLLGVWQFNPDLIVSIEADLLIKN